jgi:LmbE family N-acetylglucosaminyl deacetylase
MTEPRKKTVLVVTAHADDLEFVAGGTVARFAKECGYDVYTYILTDNVKGSYKLEGQELIDVSAKEARDAAEILGMKEVRLEGYEDGELNMVSLRELREKVMGMIREVKADIVMSWDPFAPQEDHPDHRACAIATLDAASFSGNPRFHPDQPHDPYPVSEAYWFAKVPRDAECYVDITSTIEDKIAALLCHDCQMELTIDTLVQEAETWGVHLPPLLEAQGGNHAEFIGNAIRAYCAEVGEERGFAFAERFRYENLCMLEKVLGIHVVPRDFA